jgi:O-antigen/teichoic acid export membrane protein
MNFQYLKSNTFLNNFLFDNDRTRRASINVIIAFICRALMIITSFIVIPLTLKYFGPIEYGIWIAISTIINWFGFFDIGLGNGLRNKLAESIANKNYSLAKKYISSVYALIIAISIIMFLIFYLSSYFLPWKSILNTDILSEHYLRDIVNLVFAFFCLGFILKLFSSVLVALQKNWINEIIGLLSQVLGLISIFIFTRYSKPTLFDLCLIYSIQNVIVLFFASFVFYFGKLKYLRPSIDSIDLKSAFPLINMGFMFLINQLLNILLTQSPLLMIIYFFGTKDVTLYSITYKYTYSISMIYIMILTPFLSAFTESFIKNDLIWIKNTMNKINLIWLLALFISFFMILVQPKIFNLWLGSSIEAPFSLVFVMVISSLIETKSSTYSLFLNGIGVLKIQTKMMIIQTFLFFILFYFLYFLNLGLISIVFVQIAINILSYFVYSNQYRSIVNSMEHVIK